MIRCLAVDDEPLALKKLASYIQKVPYLELAGTCHSAQEAVDACNNNAIDVLFVDINMPDMNGLDFVKSLPEPPIVVFTTAYSEYAIEGYKVNAIDYLLKPYGLNDFKATADKVKKQYDLVRTASISSADEDDTIFIKTEYKIMRINLNEIIYVEAMSEYLRIFLEDKTRPIVVLLSMKKMEERLPSASFMRVHRSYIINLKKIREVSKSHIILENDVDVPVGDLYKDTFNAYIASKFLSK